MALFCIVIWRASFFHVRFPFLSHDQVFLCTILPVCRSKCPYSCFSFYFCFVFVNFQFVLIFLLLQAAAISLHLLFLMCSSKPCFGRYPHGVMVKGMDCRIVVSEFVLQSMYYVRFRENTLGKGMNPPYPPSYGLNSAATVFLGELIWH